MREGEVKEEEVEHQLEGEGRGKRGGGRASTGGLREGEVKEKEPEF